MAIIMADNFTINLEKSLDDRTYFKTKKAMKDFSINKTTVIGANYIFPITSGSIGYCEETGKHYYFAGRKTDGTITMTVPDAKLEDMGYWKELKLGGGGGAEIVNSLPPTGDESKLYLVKDRTINTITVGEDLSKNILKFDDSVSFTPAVSDEVIFESANYKVVHKSTGEIILEDTSGLLVDTLYDGTIFTTNFTLPEDFGEITNVSSTSTLLGIIEPFTQIDKIYSYTKENGYIQISSSVSGKIASTTDLGMIKVGLGLTIKKDGTLSLADYSEKKDPVTGEITVTSGGISYKKDPTTGKITGTTVGGLSIGSTSISVPTAGGGTETTVVETVGGTTTTTVTTTDPSGNPIGSTVTQTVGGVTVNTTTTTTTTGSDTSGNPTTTTSTTTTTPTGSTTSTTTSTSLPTGGTITEEKKETSGAGMTETTTTTTETDTTGSVIDTKTETEYTGSDDMFASRDDIDNVYDDIFGDLGW